MLRDKFEIGGRLSSGEVATFLAFVRANRQPVMLHLLPALPERRQYWLSRLQERLAAAGGSTVLESGESEGRTYVVTPRLENFTGFGEWLNSPNALPAAGMSNASVSSPESTVSGFFRPPMQATEMLGRAAKPPQRKRDYQPPSPPKPSDYSQLFQPSNANAPALDPVMAVAPSPPATIDPMAQAVLVAQLQERLRLWQILACVGLGLVVLLLVVLFVALLRSC